MIRSSSATERWRISAVLARTSEIGGESEEEMDEMTKAMLEYMPIRVLRSFGDLDNEKIEEILKQYRDLLK